MRLVIVFAEVMRIVSRYKRNIQFALQLEHVGVDALFLFEALILDLEEKIATTKDVLILHRRGTRSIVVALEQMFAELTRKTAREADQSARMPRQQAIF